ncbi:MAG: hypothetical protein CMB49_02165 [Euryarchaeota archaeon]|nr:hypothetical protein [Euryarchaeota archaeon]
MAEIGDDMEDSALRIQEVVQEIQLVAQQLGALSNQVREIKETLSLLSTQQEDHTVYRQKGGVLVRVQEIEKLVEELEDGRVRIEEHVSTLANREDELREEYENLVKTLEASK